MSVSFLLGGHLVTVDAEDLYLALGLKLRIVDKTRHLKRKLYVEHCERIGGHIVHISLHRLIAGVTDPSVLVDHKNGNGLNCTRANLRSCTRAENARNASAHTDCRSGLRGVSRAGKRWQDRIQAHGEKRYLGTFPTPELAYATYCQAAVELHGQFAAAR